MSIGIDSNSDSLSPLSSTPSDNSTLAAGASGASVVALQQKLAHAGFNPGAADGSFGPSTAKAVRSFQAAHGLPQTGAADAKTLTALQKAPSTLTKAIHADTFQAPKASPTGINASKLATINSAPLHPGKAHTCVASTVANLERAGLSGLPKNGTAGDPNNPRGAMVQMLQSGDWSSQAVPGSTQQTIKSPYGTVSANVMSGADYDKAVANGTIPNGAVVFQTEHGWSWNQGSSGNDMGILRNGKVFNYTQNNTPNVYANVKQVVILLPK